MNVTHLDLRYCPLTNAGMARASAAMPRLEYCNVEGCRLTCLGIVALMRRHRNLRVWGPGEQQTHLSSGLKSQAPHLLMPGMIGTCSVRFVRASLLTVSRHSLDKCQGGFLKAVGCFCRWKRNVRLACVQAWRRPVVMVCDKTFCVRCRAEQPAPLHEHGGRAADLPGGARAAPPARVPLPRGLHGPHRARQLRRCLLLPPLLWPPPALLHGAPRTES